MKRTPHVEVTRSSCRIRANLVALLYRTVFSSAFLFEFVA